jgi:hypothetical protein
MIFNVCIEPDIDTAYTLFPSEPDVLRWPIWLLTAAALAEGITITLLERYMYALPWYEHQSLQEKRKGRCIAEMRARKREDILERVREQTEGVLLDLMAALGAREVSSFR